MRNAYALLGLSFLIVFLGAYLLIERAQAPQSEHASYESNLTLPMLTLTSPAFEEGGTIPAKYTCDGDNISPELRIEGVPPGTRALVLVMDDPDIPDFVKTERGIEKFDHWVLYNIPSDTTVIGEGASEIGSPGLTSRGSEGYTGPCPPDREHRYIFRLYALSEELAFETPPTLDAVEREAREKMLESASLIGRYERSTRED